jgi:site-specific DNA recombinase
VIRAAAYVRVSTARQADEGLSLDAQQRGVLDHIEREGWELAGLYVERGVSGRRAARPELDRLLGSLGSIDRLVIPKLDRLGRSNRHLHDLFERLQAAGVELVSLADSIDTSTSAGRLMRNMLANLAEFESDTIGERVKAVTAARAEQGKHHGRPPFGYESREGALYVAEPAASVVRRIFEDFTNGTSQRALSRALNVEGVPTHTGRTWTQGTLSKILSNSTYIGRVVVNGEDHEGAHQPLVSVEVWDRAVKLREATARTTGKGRGRPSSGSHLFTRSLRLTCIHCGEAMIPRTNRDRRVDRSYEVYLCHGRIKHGIDSCPMLPVPRAAVDEAVFDYFAAVALDLDAMRDELRGAASAKAAEVSELVRRAERDEREAAAAIARVRRDYTSGELTAAEWRELSPDLKSDHEAATAKLAQLRAREADVRASMGALNEAEGEAVRRLAEVRAAVAGQVNGVSDLDAVRATLARMFESFTIARATVSTLDELSPVVRALVERQELEIGRAMAAFGAAELDLGRWIITPWARPEVVAGVDETWRPILHREPLTVAPNIDAVGLQT